MQTSLRDAYEIIRNEGISVKYSLDLFADHAGCSPLKGNTSNTNRQALTLTLTLIDSSPNTNPNPHQQMA